jgi:hypothetical protein
MDGSQFVEAFGNLEAAWNQALPDGQRRPGRPLRLGESAATELEGEPLVQ